MTERAPRYRGNERPSTITRILSFFGIERSRSNIFLDPNPNTMLQMKANGPYTRKILADSLKRSNAINAKLSGKKDANVAMVPKPPQEATNSSISSIRRTNTNYSGRMDQQR